MNKKIALYIRTSTNSQDMGLAGQEKQVRAFLASRAEFSRSEALLFKDEGISGKKKDRPELNRLLSEIKKGRISHLVVPSLSRIARSVKHLLTLLDIFEQHHVKLISLAEQFDTSTATGKLVLHILAAIGEFESSIASERTKISLASAQDRGIRLGAPNKPKDKNHLLSLRKQGLSLSQIAEQTSLSLSTVYRTLKKEKRYA